MATTPVTMDPLVLIAELHLSPGPYSDREDVTFRYLQTVRPAASDQWDAFVESLAGELSDSGLGTLPRPLSARETAGDEGAGDLVIVLRHLDYGRRLVDDAVRQHEIAVEPPILPRRWLDYRCGEYFTNSWHNPDFEDSTASSGCICSLSHIYEDLEHEFLAIGSSGCGGIDFGYRKGQSGLWAYYPGEDFFIPVAGTVAELAAGWRDGRVTV